MLILNEVSEVNTGYIHMKLGDGSQKSIKTSTVSLDDLRCLYNDCITEKLFYERLRKEMQEILDNDHEELRKEHCPTEDEIRVAGLWDGILLAQKRECHLEKCHETTGIYSIFKMACENRDKYDRLSKQIVSVFKQMAAFNYK